MSPRTLVPLFLAALAACSSGPDEAEIAEAVFERTRGLFAAYKEAREFRNNDAARAAATDLFRVASVNIDRFSVAMAGSDDERAGYAAFVLGFSRSSRAIAPLVQGTEHSNETVRIHALASLGALGLEAVPVDPFRRALADEREEIRQAAIVGIQGLIGPDQDRGLLETLHQAARDPSTDVRNEAFIALHVTGKKESFPVAMSGMKDREPMVRANAALAMGSLGKAAIPANPFLIEMLRDEEARVVKGAWAALNRINEKDYDRSYGTWRDWFEDELKHVYVCPDDAKIVQPTSGDCPACGKRLERLPRPDPKKGAVLPEPEKPAPRLTPAPPK